MFFAPERLPVIQRVLMNASEAKRLSARVQAAEAALADAPSVRRQELQAELNGAKATLARSQEAKAFREGLSQLEEFQRSDFSGILEAMRDLPVIIRLLDAPLHEFLPKKEELLKARFERQAKGQATKEQDTLIEVVDRLHEQNPMLGHRGVRLGVTFPEIYEMQMRAIIRAAAQLEKKGVKALPEIMIPITGHLNELKFMRPILDKAIAQVKREEGLEVHCPYGTMIEVPRAALVADELASVSEFFSVGSNDLTQMSWGYSRDDAEGKFLGAYMEMGVLNANPFSTLDTEGVGQLMRMAVEKGRAARPGMSIGICGEHGGDPKSVFFCHQIGLTYVSASPLRVPVSRLAAAQVAVKEKAKATH
jgi:pyruvate,orthophosphate dikinase